MKIKTIPSRWMEENGRRLDCGPYMSGAIEARELLRKHNTTPLMELTAGHNGGIFNGPRFPRTYVEDPEYGIPFLGSVDILQADLSSVSLLSKTQVQSKPDLIIDEGWSLITCSGTIGRMAYARSDMKGMAGSQHFMRVVPDTQKIKSGYLYAYLSSKFGVPLIISGTYGAIIRHIEPHHVADLPVPRLGKVENQAHELVQQAADLRTNASEIIANAIELFEERAGLPNLSKERPTQISFDVGAVSSNLLVSRIDALFHSQYHGEVIRALKKARVSTTTVGDLSMSIVEPVRFKRNPVDDQSYGVPFFGTTALMYAEPKPTYFLPKSQRGIEQYLVNKSTVLIPRSGQLSGIIGTAVIPYGELIGGAITEDAIRVFCEDEELAGYLFVALKSEYGRRQLKARAFGSSIPHLDVNQISQVVLPKFTKPQRTELGILGVKCAQLRNEAINLENSARILVEDAIEGGAS